MANLNTSRRLDVTTPGADPEEVRMDCSYPTLKVLKVKPVYQQMTLSPKLGVVGISTLWHFRLPLPIQIFIKVASSPRLSGIGMPSPILWSRPLKMQRIVLLSSLLWWEIGTNSLITGPGEWLSFRRFTSKLSWSWSWQELLVSWENEYVFGGEYLEIYV